MPESDGPTRSDLDPSCCRKNSLWADDDASRDGWFDDEEEEELLEEQGGGAQGEALEPGVVGAAFKADSSDEPNESTFLDGHIASAPAIVPRRSAKSKAVEDFWADKVRDYLPASFASFRCLVHGFGSRFGASRWHHPSSHSPRQESHRRESHFVRLARAMPDLPAMLSQIA